VIIVDVKFVESMGVELECGINKREAVDLALEYASKHRCLNKIDIGTDGSVHVNATYKGKELRIHDYTKNDYKDLMSMLELLYANDIKVDSSCGFHIHVKLENPQLYAVFQYMNTYNEFIKAYGDKFKGKDKYLERLHGTYGKGYDNEDALIQNVQGTDRYRAINFQSIPRHGTLEFRVFPRQDSYEEAKDTIFWLKETVDGMLGKPRKLKTEKITVE
jgi:Putative amidoligase enzyme